MTMDCDAFRDWPLADLDEHNLAHVDAINDDGRIYLTQTKLDGQIVIRFQAGSIQMEEQDAGGAFNVISEFCQRSIT